MLRTCLLALAAFDTGFRVDLVHLFALPGNGGYGTVLRAQGAAFTIIGDSVSDKGFA